MMYPQKYVIGCCKGLFKKSLTVCLQAGHAEWPHINLRAERRADLRVGTTLQKKAISSNQNMYKNAPSNGCQMLPKGNQFTIS